LYEFLVVFTHLVTGARLGWVRFLKFLWKQAKISTLWRKACCG